MFWSAHIDYDASGISNRYQSSNKTIIQRIDDVAIDIKKPLIPYIFFVASRRVDNKTFVRAYVCYFAKKKTMYWKKKRTCHYSYFKE